MASKDPLYDLLLSTYKTNPNVFTNEDVDFLRQRAKELGADFTPQSSDANLLRTAQQAYYGFINGLTTLEVGDQPRNDVEQLFHNIGHLAGFMGFVPGAGTIASMSAKGFARGIGYFMGKEVGAKGGMFVGSLLAGKYGKSLPLMGADWLGKGTSAFIQKNAMLSSLKFLQEGNVVRDIAAGAAHLGVASAISAAPSIPVVSWDWDIENRVNGLIGGIEAGAAFRILGNTLKPNVVRNGLKGLGVEATFLDDASKLQTTTNVARAVAASAYMGLPSTMRGDPGLLQVYEYVAGGAFGLMERSVGEKQAGQFLYEQTKKKNDLLLYEVFDEAPKLEGWDRLTPEAQELVRGVAAAKQGKLYQNLDTYSRERGYETVSTGGIIEAKALVAFRDRVTEEVRTGKLDKETGAQHILAAEMLSKEMQYRSEFIEAGRDAETADEMAFKKMAKEVANTASEAQTIREQLDAVYLKARIEENAANSLDIFMSEDVRFEIADAFKEAGVDIRFVNPLYDLATMTQQKPVQGRELMSEGEWRKSIVKDSMKLVSATIGKGGDVEDFIKSYESLYGKMSEEGVGMLKQSWLNIVNAETQPQLSVNTGSGNVIDVSEFDAAGGRNIQTRPYSFAEQMIRGLSGSNERVFFIGDAFKSYRTASGDSYNEIVKLYREIGRERSAGSIDIDVKEGSVLPKLLTKLSADDMMVIGGMKATDRLVAIKSLVKEIGIEPSTDGTADVRYVVRDSDLTFTMREKLEAAREAINDYNSRQSDPKRHLEDPFSMYEKQLQEFASLFRGSADKEYSEIPEQQLRRMFEKNYANNISFIEFINSDGKNPASAVPWDVIMTNPDKFITNAQALNKRNQIIFAGEHRANQKYFENIPGVSRDVNDNIFLNYLIVEAKDSFNSETGPIDAYEMRNGKPERVQVDTHLDGIVLLRHDVFDALMDYAGMPKTTGHQKGTLLHSQAGIGMILGKFAYHRAAPELNKHMMEKDIHMHAYDTAIKQTGLRDKVGLRYSNANGYEYVSKTTDGLTPLYSVPVEALSINFSAGEHPRSQMANQAAVVQLYSNLNLIQAPKKVMDDMYQFIRELGIEGDKEANSKFSAYETVMKTASELEKKGDKENAERIIASFDPAQIDVAKLGLAETIKIVKDPYLSRTPLYDKMMRHILKLDREGALRNEDDGIIDGETQNVDHAMSQMRSGAMRAFEQMPQITPFMVEAAPPLRQYAQAVLASHVLKKAKRPEMPYSFKAIMTPYQLEMHNKYNLRAGEYMLDAGMKEKLVEYHSDISEVSQIKLGDLWSKYDAIVNKNGGELSDKEVRLAELWLEDMQHAVVRVPADSVSGIRVLQFKGFTDVDGYGILLHPEDMKNLGGADLDIDSAFIYTKLPYSVKKFYGSRPSMEEAYRYFKYDSSNNTFGPESHRNDPQAVPVFGPPKDAMKEILYPDTPELAAIKKHPMSMFNPAVTIRANQDTYRANMILGPGLYHTRRLAAMHDMTNAGEIGFRNNPAMAEHILDQLIPGLQGREREQALENMRATVKTKFKPGAKDLRDATRAIVNYGADADGKYHSIDDIATMVLDKTFGKITAKVHFGDKAKMREIKFTFGDVAKSARQRDPERPLKLAFANNMYRQLQGYDKLSKAYDYENGRKLTLDEIRNISVDPAALDYKKPTSVWHRLSDDILRTLKKHIPDQPLSESVFGAAWRGKFSLTTKEFEPGIKAEISRFLASNDPVAEMLRDFSFRKNVNVATSKKQPPELEAQDAADIASIAMMREFTQKALGAGTKMETLRSIVKELDNFKRENAIRLNTLSENAKKIFAEYESRDLTKSDLYKEMLNRFRQYYATSKGLGDFASAWMVGSLYGQWESYGQWMRPMRAKLRALQDKYDSVTDTENKKVLAEKIKEESVALQQHSNRWHQTNWGAIGLNSPFVPDYIIKSYMSTLNKIVGATHSQAWTPEDAKDLVARTKKGASPQMQAIQPDAAAFNQPVARIADLTKQSDVRRFREAFYSSIEPFSKMELDARYTKMVDDLADLLYKRPQLVTNFHERILGPLAAEFDIMPTTPNLISIKRLQQSIDAWRRIVDDKDKAYQLKGYHWFLPTKFIADKMAAYDPNDFIFKVVPTMTGSSEPGRAVIDLPIRTYFSRMEQMRRATLSTNKLISSYEEALQRKMEQDNWVWFHLGKDGQDLYEIVVDLREAGRGRQSAENTAFYGLKGDEAAKRLEAYKGKRWSIPRPGGGGTMNVGLEDVVAMFKRVQDDSAADGWKRWIYNEALDTYINKVMAGRKDFTPEEANIGNWVSVNKYGIINIDRTFGRFNQALIEERFMDIPVLGQEFLRRLQWQEKMLDWEVPLNEKETIKLKNVKIPEGVDKDLYLSEQIFNVIKNQKINKNGMLNYKSLKDQQIFADEYFPHVNHSQKALKRALEARLEAIKKAGLGEDALQAAEMDLKNEMERLRAPDLKLVEDAELGWSGDKLTSVEAVERSGLNHTPGNLMARSREFGPIEGYEKTPFAWLTYNKAMAKAYFKGIEAWVNYKHIEKFERDQPFKQDTEAWAAFMKVYRRDNLGLPSLFPDQWLNNPKYHIKGSLFKGDAYYYFTDQAMYNVFSRMQAKLGKYGKHEIGWAEYTNFMYNNGGIGKFGTRDNLVSRELKNMKQLEEIGLSIKVMGREKPEAILVDGKPNEANKKRALDMAEKLNIPLFYREQFDAQMEPKKKDTGIDYDKVAEARRISAMLGRLSVMEGKWNLISLLSHTKTMIANITTGYTNTAISAGLGSVIKASSLSHISSVLPEIKSQDDLNQFREKSGALESFIKDTLGGTYEYSGRVQQFINEGFELMKKDPNLRDATIMDLAKKYKLSEGLVEKAASFMRVSERIVRGNAWMAHYLKGREALEANGYVFENNNHPWLIRMANRGVEGSQFLYDNAVKPAFARTSLGKVFFRFQQWALSSMVMRQEIAKQAYQMGFEMGSPEMEKYQRLLIADMFMMGLATLFPATFFDSNLAPPLSYMRDFADLFFGDQREKERAFYGSLPYPYNALNVISPPFMRVPTSIFGTMVSGDWERFAGYHMWTWFPFGRIARDVKRTVDSPVMIIENFTNIPVHQIERKQRAVRENPTPKQMFHSFILDGLESLPQLD